MRHWKPTRPLPFWRLFLRGWGWIAVFAVPAFVIVAAITAQSGYVAARLAIEGVATEARIQAKIYEDRDGDSRTDEEERIKLRFSFDADGVPITDTTQISEDFANSVRRLEHVPLRYAAGNPMVNEIEPGAHASEFRKGLIWLAGLLLIAGPVLRRQWRRSKAMIRVRDRGETRSAVITSHQPTGLIVNDRSSYRLHWRDERGVSGRTTLVNHRALRHFPVGSEITIYVDPTGTDPPVWQAEVGLPAGSS